MTPSPDGFKGMADTDGSALAHPLQEGTGMLPLMEAVELLLIVAHLFIFVAKHLLL